MAMMHQMQIPFDTDDAAPIQRALVVREPYASMLVSGQKTWEIRGRNTMIRETIGIVAGGTGTIIGLCDLVDVRGPFTLEEYANGYKERGQAVFEHAPALPYPQTYAWVMEQPRRFEQPVLYEHPLGAVIWVTLSSQVQAACSQQDPLKSKHI